MKYIPAEKLIAEIERRKKQDVTFRERSILIDIETAITSLWQEQPNKYETALEKAREWMPNVNQGGHAMLIGIFPELGEGLDPRYGGRKQGQPEVDLEKEINSYCGTRDIRPVPDFMDAVARHFYELGLKAGKEE